MGYDKGEDLFEHVRGCGNVDTDDTIPLCIICILYVIMLYSPDGKADQTMYRTWYTISEKPDMIPRKCELCKTETEVLFPHASDIEYDIKFSSEGNTFSITDDGCTKTYTIDRDNLDASLEVILTACPSCQNATLDEIEDVFLKSKSNRYGSSPKGRFTARTGLCKNCDGPAAQICREKNDDDNNNNNC